MDLICLKRVVKYFKCFFDNYYLFLRQNQYPFFIQDNITYEHVTSQKESPGSILEKKLFFKMSQNSVDTLVPESFFKKVARCWPAAISKETLKQVLSAKFAEQLFLKYQRLLLITLSENSNLKSGAIVNSFVKKTITFGNFFKAKRLK